MAGAWQRRAYQCRTKGVVVSARHRARSPATGPRWRSDAACAVPACE